MSVAGVGLRSGAQRRRSSNGPLPADGMLHPVVLASIAVLAVNDHVLKQAFPGLVTGKLSDLAGLAFFPILLVAIGELVWAVTDRWRGPTERALVMAAAAVAAGFVAVKTTAAGALLFGWSLGVAQWPVAALGAVLAGSLPSAPAPAHVVVDPTDLVALPAVLVGLAVGTRRARAASPNARAGAPRD